MELLLSFLTHCPHLTLTLSAPERGEGMGGQFRLLGVGA
jgi:hypothetical protein